MLESARNGDIDLIFTKSISRFARNTVDIITTVRELRDIGVEIFFEKENISSLDPKIDFMLTILSSIAQEESRSISTNVKWAYDKKFKKGIVDAKRIYGYDVIDGKYVINKRESEIVKQMFLLILKGYKINDIIKKLNSEGILNIRGNKWAYGTVRYILKNERYCGDAMLRKTVTVDYLTKRTIKNDNIAEKYYVKNNHDAIVSRETYNAVQNLLNNPLANGGISNKKTKYPLTGITYCPKCGRSLKRQHVNRHANMRVILNCNHSYGNDHLCNSTNPDYDMVLNAVIDSINEIYASPDALNNLFVLFDRNVALNSLREDLKELKNKENLLTDLYHENPEDIDVFKKLTQNDEKIELLENKLTLNISSSVRLEHIKSIVQKEFSDDKSRFIKDIYSLILADAQKIVLIISPTKSREELLGSRNEILQGESILKKMFVSKDKTTGVFYEVKLYE